MGKETDGRSLVLLGQPPNNRVNISEITTWGKKENHVLYMKDSEQTLLTQCFVAARTHSSHTQCCSSSSSPSLFPRPTSALHSRQTATSRVRMQIIHCARTLLVGERGQRLTGTRKRESHLVPTPSWQPKWVPACHHTAALTDTTLH